MTVVPLDTTRGAGGRTTTGDQFRSEAESRVLVALPQSGRTSWLAHHVAHTGTRTTAGPAPLWLRGTPDGPTPPGVTDLDLAALLGTSPGELTGRTIAIDDLHAIEPADLARLADHLGAALMAGATLLATSITVPPGPFADWGQRGIIRWIGQAEVRLDADTFVRALVPVGLHARQARDLHRSFDGWAGPLAAAAAAAGKTITPHGLTEELLARAAIERADRALAPVLAPFEPLPAGISLLPSIGRTVLAETLSVADDAALRTLRRLSAPVGAADGPLRPHPALRRILERITPPGPDVEAIRARALEWYLAHDHYADAVQVLTEAHRTAEALDVIRRHQLDLVYFDGRAKQQELMEALPRFGWTIEDHIMYVMGCLSAGDHRRAGFALNSLPLAAPDLPIPMAIARNCAIAYLGMVAYPPELCIEAAEWSLRALDDLPEDTPLPHLVLADGHRLYRFITLLHLARNKIVLGAWDQALETLDLAGVSGQPLLDTAATGFRAWLHGLRGDAEEAHLCVTQARAGAEFWPEIQAIAVEARLALSEIYLLHGRLDGARDLGMQALDGATTRSSVHQMACALIVIAEAELRSGRPGHARATLARIVDGAYGFVGERADAIRARICLETDDSDGGSAILRRLPLTQHTILAHARGISGGASPLTREQIEDWQPPPWPSARQAKQEAQAALDPELGAGAPAPIAIGRAVPDPHRFAAVVTVANAHDLSRREEEILFAVLADASLSDVADHLFISRNTLKTHLRRIYRKLAVHSREEAIALVNRAELAGG